MSSKTLTIAVAADTGQTELEKTITLPQIEVQQQPSKVYRQNYFASLVLMPLFMGVGHLAPMAGAARVMLGRWFLDWPLFVALITINGFIDGYDKYRDIPKSERPSNKTLMAYMGPLLACTTIASIICSGETAWRLHRWLIFGLVYGNPLIPTYSFKTNKITFVKPKVIFAVGKSASVAFVMANVSVDVGASHACKVHDDQCVGLDSRIYWQAFALSFVYHWVRETMFDMRDIDEDREEGVPTLPVMLGRGWTLTFLAVGLFAFEQTIFEGQILAVPSIDSALRQAITLFGCLLIAHRPREDVIIWSTVAVFGMLPALWAQTRLSA